jgi:hypothetical protein
MLGRQSQFGSGENEAHKVSHKPSVGTQNNKLFYLGGKRSTLGKYPELAIRITG